METTRRTRLTLNQKNANGKNYFKDKATTLKGQAFSNSDDQGMGNASGQASEYKRMKVNYDLFNNIVDARDFEYVCKPFGAQAGELPASFSNKDIVSTRIKRMIGMEMKRPFSWTITAVNPEATTRKETKKTDMIKEFVVNSIMGPIKEELEMKYQEEQQGAMSPEQQQAIQEQMAQELKAKTPPEVEKYMAREHTDPAEALAQQLMNYTIQDQQVKRKFDKGWKHSLLSGLEVFWIGQARNRPVVGSVNSLRFDYDKSPDVDFIEDGEWAVAEYRMTPSQVIGVFGAELSNTQIDEVYNNSIRGSQVYDADWSFNSEDEHSSNTVSVYHATWKDLRRIGFLVGIDPMSGEEYEMQVDEGYRINKAAGDISLEWEWIPESYETYIIGNDIYVYMQPVQGQFKDLNDLYRCKLPYYGAATDNLNSEITSIMDRMKPWQYYYNIIMYRLELLMASDKGKLMLMNINAIPKSSGIDLEKWLYYAEALKIGWVDPSEEGNQGLDVTNMAKEINMSLMSDIQKYIELADYIDRQCGNSVGITESMMGQVAPNEAVSNTRVNIAQNSDILEPYFDLHNNVKRNVLEALLEQCKITYSQMDGEVLSYVLDDMSNFMLTIDAGLLDNSTYGIFVTNASKAHEAVELVKQMAHAAMQNQAIDLSDVIKVVRSEGIQEAEENLEVAEKKKREETQENQMQAIQEQGKNEQAARDGMMEIKEFDRETQLLIEDKKTERELQKQAMMSLGFAEDKDADGDGVPDVIEVYKAGVNADIQNRRLNLDESKHAEDKKQNKKKNELEEKKLAKSNTPKK